MNKTVIITSGDPAGIGPEIILRLASNESFLRVPAVIAGRKSLYEKLSSDMGISVSINSVDSVSRLKPGALNIIEPVCENKYIYGSAPGKSSSHEALAYLDLACALIKEKKTDRLITAPVSKEGIASLKKGFSGHTYYLSDYFGVDRQKAVMLFLSRAIRVVLVTQHLAIKDVPPAVKKEAVLAAAEAASEALKFLGIKVPRLAVCSLNPHCGEGGLLGGEERDEIIPAVEELKKRGAAVSGPMGADDVAAGCLKNEYDIAIAMYHDQGIAPVKLFSHGRAVNFTWGLPFIRLSPLHGTAFDIAGKFTASAESMIECFRIAAGLEVRRGGLK
ncbi:MAG: 4-hydroxythreonine-4-phosphate dehydrogenase PdxA [Elusimicrobiota bacterium]|nr:4-hydroxythreonine-4-phosphate dehydrogenase PdxA [Elusimicrobiota bacterium]